MGKAMSSITTRLSRSTLKTQRFMRCDSSPIAKSKLVGRKRRKRLKTQPLKVTQRKSRAKARARQATPTAKNNKPKRKKLKRHLKTRKRVRKRTADHWILLLTSRMMRKKM